MHLILVALFWTLSFVKLVDSFITTASVRWGYQPILMMHHKDKKRKISATCISFSSSSGSESNSKPTRAPLFPFREARRIARGHGFESREEFLEYSCPGAYQLPKNADEVWSDDWTGWEDFLGVPLVFQEARSVARTLAINNPEDYMALMKFKDDEDIMKGFDQRASRLPYRPDLKFKQEWISWSDWLGVAC